MFTKESKTFWNQKGSKQSLKPVDSAMLTNPSFSIVAPYSIRGEDSHSLLKVGPCNALVEEMLIVLLIRFSVVKLLSSK